MAYYAYIRTSDNDPAALVDDALETQTKRVSDIVAYNSEQVTEYFYDNNVQGDVLFCERPEASRLLSVLKRGDVVVVSSIDRIGTWTADVLTTLDRLQNDEIMFASADIGLLPTDLDAAGKFQVQMMVFVYDSVRLPEFGIAQAKNRARRDAHYTKVETRNKELEQEAERLNTFLADRCAEISRLRAYASSLESAAICPECGMSLLSDHDVDCRYWGKALPAVV